MLELFPLSVYASTVYPVSSDNEIVKFFIYFADKDELSSYNTFSYRDISTNEISSTLKAGKYFANILSKYETKRDTVELEIYTKNEKNVSGGFRSWGEDNLTYPQPIYVLKDVKEFGPLPNSYEKQGSVILGFDSSHFNYELNRNQNIIPWNLETIIIHELGHSFGISGETPIEDYNSQIGPNQFGIYLQDPNGKQLVEINTTTYTYNDLYSYIQSHMHNNRFNLLDTLYSFGFTELANTYKNL
ncbi:MAG: hypothetical protein LBI10_00715 [Deltaproteobacteria bacterium]|nr:hypothetical protein [Deltaproteobacteria bacterium]